MIEPATGTDNGRERLLQAGLELFGQKGFAATSVSDLCARAGVSRGLIGFHFGSKQALADAVEDFALAKLDIVAERNALRYAEIGLEEGLRLQGFDYGPPDVAAYLRRTMIDPTPRNLKFFARLFDKQRQIVEFVSPKTDIDIRHLTAIKIFMEFGPLLLRPQIEAVFGESINSKSLKSGLVEAYLRFVSVMCDIDKLTTKFGTAVLPAHLPRRRS